MILPDRRAHEKPRASAPGESGSTCGYCGRVFVVGSLARWCEGKHEAE